MKPDNVSEIKKSTTTKEKNWMAVRILAYVLIQIRCWPYFVSLNWTETILFIFTVSHTQG